MINLKKNVSPLWVSLALFVTLMAMTVSGEIQNGPGLYQSISEHIELIVAAAVISLAIGLSLNSRLAGIGDVSANHKAARIYRRAIVIVGGGLLLILAVLSVVRWRMP